MVGIWVHEPKIQMLTGLHREEKFETIDARLSRLDSALHGFIQSGQSKVVPRPTPASASSQIESVDEYASAEPLDESSENRYYRGDSSFDVHSGEASKILENAIRDPPTLDTRQGSSPLQSLFHSDRPCSHSHFEHDMTMPSRDLVLKALKVAKGNHLPYHFITMSDLYPRDATKLTALFFAE